MGSRPAMNCNIGGFGGQTILNNGQFTNSVGTGSLMETVDENQVLLTCTMFCQTVLYYYSLKCCM